MPVVATTTSGGLSTQDSVAARSSLSSVSGTIRSAGASTTRAPRRSSSADSSSRRRSAVTPIVKPARGSGSPTDFDHPFAQPHPVHRDAYPRQVEALAGAQVVHLLVHGRRDGRRPAPGTDDAARQHGRAADRVQVADGVHLAVVGTEQGHLRAPDEGGHPAFGLQPGVRADGRPRHARLPSITGTGCPRSDPNSIVGSGWSGALTNDTKRASRSGSSTVDFHSST